MSLELYTHGEKSFESFLDFFTDKKRTKESERM